MGRPAGSAESWWVVFVGSLGLANFGAFLWLAEHTEAPPVPVGVVLLVSTLVLLVGPWAYVAVRRLDDAVAAGRIVRRVLATVVALVGVSAVVGLILGPSEDSDALSLLMLAILVAGAVALVGLVVGPWLFLLTRTVTRERAARVRADERAELANHLHDSVLQTLTLIQKRADADGEVVRLARSSERELRRWLYGGAPAGDDDLAGALARAAEGVEDRFGLSVELVTVGTCPSAAPTQALVGAVTEALTNAAKHAGVPRVSVFAEVDDDVVSVTVRDRGRGFDPELASGDGRGLANSIVGRMGQHGGTAAVRSRPGAGTVVELRLPLRAPSARGTR